MRRAMAKGGILLTSIEWRLPGGGAESKEAYAALAELLGAHAGAGEALRLAPAAGDFPETAFALCSGASASIVLVGDGGACHELGRSLMPAAPAPAGAVDLAEAARRLAGFVRRVDHTGLVAPAGADAGEWSRAVGFLAERAALWDYPECDGYDPKSARWLFAIPLSAKEMAGAAREPRRRQPKFELVWDPRIEVPCAQLDFETSLAKEQIAEMFPGGQSRDLPGLGDYFRSVDVRAPWPGLGRLRLDLRYAGCSGGVDPWSSGEWIMGEGVRVSKGAEQARIGPGASAP